MEKSHSRRSDMDFLRIVSSFMVVLLHTAAMGVLIPGEKGFLTNTVFNCISRFSVPVFVMISGYFMLGEERGIAFYLKRSAKLIFIMILWSCLYLVKYTVTDAVEIKGIKNILIYLLTEPVHLWYFYALAALTLFTPVFSVFAKNADKKTFIYMLVLTFVFGTIITMLLKSNRFYTLQLIADKMKMSTLLAFTGYYFFGFYVKKFGIHKKGAAAWAGALGLLVTIAGTLMISFKDGALNEAFMSFFAPNTAFVSGAVFVCFEGKEFAKTKKLISLIAPLTAGIYGIHIIFLGTVYSALSFISSEIVKVVFATVVTYIVSAAVVYALKKIRNYILHPKKGV